MAGKTFVACRPGMLQKMQSAFDGLEVVVDDALTIDYEFRERPMTLDELLEEEVSKEERQEADPKNALTVVVPLVATDLDLEDGHGNHTYACIRVQQGFSWTDVVRTVSEVPPTLGSDGDVNISATIGSLTAALKKAGANVLSISPADGLTYLKL